jgi:hypothetical protein
VYSISDVRQAEIHTVKSLVPYSSPSDVEVAIAKWKKYKLVGGDQILAEPIQARGEILRSRIYKFINSVWSNEELPNHGKDSIIVPIYKRGDKSDCSNYRGI